MICVSAGYEMKKDRQLLNHDLTLFAKNKNAIDFLIQTIQVFVRIF